VSNKNRRVGLVLKASLFATGCAGIVAEFVLSTLATYLLGNAIYQWTIVMSLMLFAMGIGSRISRYFKRFLLDVFIVVEFVLSLLCAMSAGLAYGLAAHTNYIGLVIYSQALLIGCLIGLELPLATRLNQAYEELRINISGVLEKDYYGALVGGLAFALIGLPRLGLTYTPIVLGAINFLVASVLLWCFLHLVNKKKTLASLFVLSLGALILLGLGAQPIMQYGEQRKYRDKVVYAQQTPFQKIVMTRWKDYYWLFINGQEQFSTYDEEKYHEPLVHPAMSLARHRKDVLILGGGDGLALREVLKYSDVENVTLVDIDPAMTQLAKKHAILQGINQGSLMDPRVQVINQDAYGFIKNSDGMYGVIVVDLPDPDSVDLMHVYSVNFYQLLRRHLMRGGVMVTQASSPYFSNKAFLCILKTIRSAGFSTLPYHNQIPTMGEWGWVLGVDARDISDQKLKKKLLQTDIRNVETKFINRDALVSMIHFGKGIIDAAVLDAIDINTEISPVLYHYYLAGNWGVY
jgi:spermidine synthase